LRSQPAVASVVAPLTNTALPSLNVTTSRSAPDIPKSGVRQAAAVLPSSDPTVSAITGVSAVMPQV
jgi:hypothetical protein